MTKKIGFIGTGNMGKAMIQGLLNAGLYQGSDMVIFDSYQPLAQALGTELGVQVASDEVAVATAADMIVLAVKPNVIATVLTKISSHVVREKMVISIAAGVTIETIQGFLGQSAKVVRVMPNTPALVGEGMSALAINQKITPQEEEILVKLFSSFGEAEVIGESLMDAVVGVSGSAPAYVYMFIEALADGAVLMGMSRSSAYKFAAQTVLGSAKMVLETGEHPGVLKDRVCSPGGTTIAAVHELESANFRGTVMKAVKVAAEKNKELS